MIRCANTFCQVVYLRTSEGLCELCCAYGRDVSSVELLMNNHQGIKAEIDARNDSFTACIELGKSLLARKHYASEEVRSRAFRTFECLIRKHRLLIKHGIMGSVDDLFPL